MHIIRTCNWTYKPGGWLVHIAPCIYLRKGSRRPAQEYNVPLYTYHHLSKILEKSLNESSRKSGNNTQWKADRLIPEMTPRPESSSHTHWHHSRGHEEKERAEVSNCKITALIARLLAVFRKLGIDGGFPLRCFPKRVLFLRWFDIALLEIVAWVLRLRFDSVASMLKSFFHTKVSQKWNSVAY